MEKNKLNIIVRKINGEIKDIQQQLEDSYGRFDSYYKNINNLLEKNKGQMELEKSIKTRFKNFFIDYVDKVQGLNLKLTTKNELKKSILIENPDVENDLRKQELIKSILLINKKIKENPQEFPKEYITKIKKSILFQIKQNNWVSDFLPLISPELLEQKEEDIILEQKLEKKYYSDIILQRMDGKILLLRRNKENNFMPNTWCLPGGHIEKGESVKIAALREFEEETGLNCIDYNFQLYHNYKNDDVEIYYFLSNMIPIIPSMIILNEIEHDNYIWVKIEELSSLILLNGLKERLMEIFKIKKDDN